MRLSWLINAIHFTPTFFRQAILTRKVGQTDLVFGVRSGFISSSVHGRLQVSVCNGYTICCTLANIETHIHTHRQTVFWAGYIIYVKSSAKAKAEQKRPLKAIIPSQHLWQIMLPVSLCWKVETTTSICQITNYTLRAAESTVHHKTMLTNQSRVHHNTYFDQVTSISDQ